MAHERIPEFQPSETWLADWPHGVSTLVRVVATVSGAGAAGGVAAFLEPRHHNADADVPDGVEFHYWGGHSAEVTAPASGDGAWEVLLASAGEDAFDSVAYAAHDLVEALRASRGDVELVWRELPASLAG